MRTQKTVIQFHFLSPVSELRNRTNLKAFIRTIFLKENTPVERLNFIFCNDDYLYQLNIAFLNHNTLTDIITFPLSGSGTPVISDIYISTERVRENARKLDVSFISELHRVIFHGILHLCGYQDKSALHKQRMREKENFYLNEYFRST